MHIRQAKPAPKHALIPTPALTALLAAERDGRVGKGHLATVLKMAVYLWGNTTLEGSAADFAAALTIDGRTVRRHVPEVGSTGCWHCTQPYHGFYVIHGFARSTEEAEAIRSAWKEARATGCRSFLEVSRFWTGLSTPVVVLSSPNNQSTSSRREQQHGLDKGGDGGGESRTILSESQTKLSEALLPELAALLSDDVAARLLAEYGVEKVVRQLAHYRWAKRQGKANSPGWLLRAIEGDWDLPAEVATRLQALDLPAEVVTSLQAVNRRRYITGQYAKFIEH